MRQTSPLIPLACLLFAIVTWASAFPLVHLAVQHVAPIPLAALRFGIAGLVGALVLLMMRRGLPARENWRGLLINGWLSMVVYSVLYNSGQATMSGGPAAFLIQTMPIFVAIIAWIAHGEKPSRALFAGSLLSLAGVGIIASASAGAFSFNWGALYLIGAALVSALSYLWQKPLLARMHAVEASCWLMLVGGLTFAPALPLAFGQLAEAPGEVHAAILYLGLVPAFLSYAAWSIALKHFSAARATNALFLIPPVAMLMGVVWFQEWPHLREIMGGLVVISGVVVVNLRRS